MCDCSYHTQVRCPLTYGSRVALGNESLRGIRDFITPASGHGHQLFSFIALPAGKKQFLQMVIGFVWPSPEHTWYSYCFLCVFSRIASTGTLCDHFGRQSRLLPASFGLFYSCSSITSNEKELIDLNRYEGWFYMKIFPHCEGTYVTLKGNEIKLFKHFFFTCELTSDAWKSWINYHASLDA